MTTKQQPAVKEGVIESTPVARVVQDTASAEQEYVDTVWVRNHQGQLFHVEVGSEAHLRLIEGHGAPSPADLEEAFNEHARNVNRVQAG